MGALSWVLIGLNFAATSCALWAAITARSSLKALRMKLAERSTRSLRQLDAELAELSSMVSTLSTTTRRISSRIGMQDVRARRTTAQLSQEPSQLSKAELRKALQTGQLQVIRDGSPRAAAQAASSARSDD